jgi:UDP-GlcNAc3NAcA epimerase
LLTVHRAENADDPDRLRAILSGVANAKIKTVFPLHPRTRSALGGMDIPSNVLVIDPVGYLEMLALEDGAEVVVTDSGGVQKEAYFAGRPCVTLRETTEWPETVDAGWNRLVGTDVDAISSALRSFRPTAPRQDRFGDGHAAERVVAAMEGAPD